MTKKLNTLLIGCGAMGGTLLKSWLKNLSKYEFSVVDRHVKKMKGVTSYKDLKDIPAKYQPDVIVLAVKPQDLVEVLHWCKEHVMPKTVVISIAASKKLDFYADYINYTQPIIRTMPNFPAQVEKGITLMAANARTTKEQCKIATELMESVGNAYWIEEHTLDNLAPLTGSGPAYMFLWAEYLMSCMQRKGVSPETARQMVTDLLMGSSLMLQESKEDPLELRRQVTSSKGITEAALNVFIPSLQHLLNNALDAAIKRSDEIAEEGAVKHESPKLSAFE